MHELPAVRSVLDIVLRHADRADAREVRRVFLEIDGPTDLEPRWLRRYWDRLTSGTVADGATLEVILHPPRARCGSCGTDFPLATARPWRIRRVRCPSCGSRECRLLEGRGWTVKNMEVL